MKHTNQRKLGRSTSGNIRQMVIASMFSAITALLVFTPLGMITLPPPLLSVTTVHIPVIVAALVEGPVVGLITALTFGVCSCIRAWETGSVGLTLFFRNPLVSVLPRLIVPLVTVMIYGLWKKGIKPSKVSDKVGVIIASVAGAITNTVLCLGMLLVIYGASLTELIGNMVSSGSADAVYIDQASTWLVTIVGLPNGIAEALVAAIVVPLIKVAVDQVVKRTKFSGR